MDKRDFLKTLSSAAVAAPVAAITASIVAPNDAPNSSIDAGSAAPAYDRVATSRTLRCAYAPYNPMLIIDPNTRQLSGIFYDLVNEIGKRAGLNVEWVEEVGYGNINAGFVTKRYEAFAAGLWPAGSRALNTVFSAPLFYDPISVWVNANDTRFDGPDGWQRLNSPDYTVAYTDGDATQNMKGAFFPNAKNAPSSQGDTIAEECDKVATRKADAMFRDLISGHLYLQSNPGSIKNASPDKPVIMYPLTIGFNQNEHGLKGMVDAVIYELQQDGTVARTLKKYLGANSPLFMYADVTYKAFA